MESFVSVTYQIDDAAAAAGELCDQVDGFGLKANSVGLLFCYSDADQGELLELLARQLPFPVAGCTTIASMDHQEGFHALSATLTVLTADDCGFAVSLSEPINNGNVAERIAATYRDCAAACGEQPGLLIALPPYQLEIMLDVYSAGLGVVAPGVPVIGGLPSYNGNGDNNLVFCGGRTYPDRLVLVGVTGNVHPVFTVATANSGPIERKRKVTASKDNVIYKVGGQTFTDYLQEVGMPLDILASGNNTVAFVSNPLLVETGPGFAFLRTLHEIDLVEGSGTAIGEVPQDATVSVCLMSREEITSAADEGIGTLQRKMAGQPGYRYSTVLAVSCIGRHLIMTPNSGAETDRLLAGLPEGLTLSGFYSYGELGPLSGTEDHPVLFAHNESLVLCAF